VSEFGVSHGGCDRVSLEINLEAMMKQVWRCTWRPRLCELGDGNHASLEIYLEGVIE